MKRLQVQLEEEQLEALRRLAARRQVSLAALVREAVDAGLGRYRASLARRTSLVDHISFEVMRWRGIRQAFAFGADFTEQGFETVPR